MSSCEVCNFHQDLEKNVSFQTGFPKHSPHLPLGKQKDSLTQKLMALVILEVNMSVAQTETAVF